ncbi:MAG: helix-turn-helix domain-containing protein [Acidimicrobiales bacterium]
MIEVAERLFAERGINGVSLREIGAVAGQRNTAAARYHFGTKQGLVDAIFEHRMTPINARRVAMLDEFDRDGRGYELRALTEAFVVPLSEMLCDVGRPSWYLRFCVNAAFSQGSTANALGRDDWTRGMHTVRLRVAELLEHLAPDVRADRWTLFAGYIAHALADRELAVGQGRAARLSSRDVFLGGLVDTAVALVAAPQRKTSVLAPLSLHQQEI